jgi:hypothetical protein
MGVNIRGKIAGERKVFYAVKYVTSTEKGAVAKGCSVELLNKN